MTQLIFRDNPDEDVQKVQVKLATYQRQYIHSTDNITNRQYMDDHILPNKMTFCHDKLNGPNQCDKVGRGRGALTFTRPKLE